VHVRGTTECRLPFSQDSACAASATAGSPKVHARVWKLRRPFGNRVSGHGAAYLPVLPTERYLQSGLGFRKVSDRTTRRRLSSLCSLPGPTWSLSRAPALRQQKYTQREHSNGRQDHRQIR
jgi:hypothetical protein